MSQSLKTFIILLRGVNVGGKNILPMKELKASLEAHEFDDIKTYIQSGNIILKCSKDPRTKVAALIQENFGFTPDLMTLTKADFGVAYNNNPYTKYEGKFVHFYFCTGTPKLDNDKINKYLASNEQYELIDKVFYLHAPDGIGRSKLVSNIENCLGISATGRNLNTINKLLSLLSH
ncbi:MAG: hypothetical protein ACI93R_003742 [Flavobacteriales bacterium]|jgi:uncharacterized protein (DUF1697 family)